MPALSPSDSERRRSSSTNPPGKKYKFPDLSPNANAISDDEERDDIAPEPSPAPLMNGLPQGLHSSERWPARRSSRANNRSQWGTANGSVGMSRHGRQRSLSEAIKIVRTRKASISENAHEIAESLKAPVSFTLVVRCPRNPLVIKFAAVS